MAKLIYSMLTSLDGHIEDAHGHFGGAAPDEEVHSYVNQLASSLGTYLYGREDGRDDGLLGDRASDPKPAAIRARVGTAMAGGRKYRLLEDSGGALQRSDANLMGFDPERSGV